MKSAGTASPAGASRHSTPNRAGTRHPCLVLSESTFDLPSRADCALKDAMRAGTAMHGQHLCPLCTVRRIARTSAGRRRLAEAPTPTVLAREIGLMPECGCSHRAVGVAQVASNSREDGS